MQSLKQSALALSLCAALAGCASNEPPLPEGERVAINFADWQLPPATVGHPVTDVNAVGTRAVVERDRVDPKTDPVVVKDDEPVPVRLAPSPVTVTPVEPVTMPQVVRVEEPAQKPEAAAEPQAPLLQQGVPQPLAKLENDASDTQGEHKTDAASDTSADSNAEKPPKDTVAPAKTEGGL